MNLYCNQSHTNAKDIKMNITCDRVAIIAKAGKSLIKVTARDQRGRKQHNSNNNNKTIRNKRGREK